MELLLGLPSGKPTARILCSLLRPVGSPRLLSHFQLSHHLLCYLGHIYNPPPFGTESTLPYFETSYFALRRSRFDSTILGQKSLR